MSLQFFTVSELSKKIKLSKSSIYSLVSNKEIPFIRIGKKILFLEHQIDEWIMSKISSDDVNA